MLLSIVILSYNRPEQIKRILNNLIKVRSKKFNLIVKDDCSPRQNEIEIIVQSYVRKCDFEIILYKNKENLGYDRNLLDAFYVADSEYVFLLSDDDFIDGRNLSGLIEMLQKHQYKVYFTPYKNNNVDCRIEIRPFELKRFEEVIYNSILFSGLIFDRAAVLSLPKDEKFLSKCIYTQVYLAGLIIFNERAFGESPANLLYLGGDGENFFGKNQSSNGQEYLQNRDAVDSNLRYQSLLIEVVRRIALNTDPEIFKIFKNEYDKRLIAYLLRVRSRGSLAYFDIAKAFIKNSNAHQWFIILAMLVFLLIPAFLADFLYKFLKRNFKKSG